jgi:endonuclease/exonuclease/phosphatase (EEP) superfamily protein YafD
MAPPRIVDRWILISFAGACAASVAGWLAPLGFPFELFSHFRLQLAVAAALLTPALWWAQRPRAAALAGVLAIVHGALAAPGLLAKAPPPACAGPSVVVITANVEFSNHDPRRFLQWLAAHPADIVVVQEVTPQWAATLRSLPGYPQQKALTREDPYGIAVLSRWPLDALQPVDMAGDGLPSLAGVVTVQGRPIDLLALHTRWPISPELARFRDRSLWRTAAHARSQPGPAVVAGDLNLTPDSPAYARLLEDSGLIDAFKGRGWQPTWMAGFWPLALRIDHVLVSPALCVERAEVGPSIGSDHRPLAVRLRLPSN